MNIKVENITWDVSGRKYATINLNGNFEKKLSKNFACTGAIVTNVQKIPRDLPNFFPNLWALYMENCKIGKILAQDFIKFERLIEIHLENLEIQEIPAEIFKNFKHLEVVSFYGNSIKSIGKNVFKNLPKLNYVDLRKNQAVNLVYADEKYKNVESGESQTRIFQLYEFLAIIDGIFHPEIEDDEDEKSLSDRHQPGTSKDQLKKFEEAKLSVNIYNDIQKLINAREFTDFTIKIDKNLFKVHKLMLAARSPTLAEMIRNNPEADELILEDIEVEVFKIILEFIYEDKSPVKYDERSEKVFAAAGKLKLESLKNQVGNILATSVTSENSLEILKLASKHNHEKLKKKAFEEFKKIFPDKNLKNELMNDLEKLEQL